MNRQLEEYTLPAKFIISRRHAQAPWPEFREDKFNEKLAPAFRFKWVNRNNIEETEEGYELKYYWESQEWDDNQLSAFKDEWKRFIDYVANKFKVTIICFVQLEDRDHTGSDTFTVKGEIKQ